VTLTGVSENIVIAEIVMVLLLGKVALVNVTAYAFNEMNDPIAAIMARNMMINPVPNCMPFMRIERISEIIIVSIRNVN
jgi:hypothetical protein